jgi:hypothetical protein
MCGAGTHPGGGVTGAPGHNAAREVLREAFATLQRQGELTARAHFAVLIDPDKGETPSSAVAELVKQQKQFDQGPTLAAPSMQVRHAKLFMDGVIAAPAFTGAMLEPYLVNRGTAARPDWRPGEHRGPPGYFASAALKATLAELAQAGIDPHIHADGDRAVRESLDAIEWLRATAGGRAVRPALAHAEIVAPADYPRFARLDVTPVLSLQWAKPAADTVGALKNYLGPARYALVEPQAVLEQAGARVAYGSDWPVDPLDAWFALKVGVTRSAAPDAGKQFAGRLTAQPGMTRAAVLRAATMNAANTLRQEATTGSLEVGKLADLIVLDRNVFTLRDEDIARVRVVQTVVGGRVVYQAGRMRVEQGIRLAGVGKFQYRLFLIFGLVWMADAMQVLSIGFSAPSIAKTFGIAVPQALETGTLFFVGMLVGAFVFGRLADRIGRRPVLMAAVVIDACFGVASAFAPDFTWLLVLRFLTGIGVGGTLPVDYTMMAEFLPSDRRGRWLVLLESFWAVGTHPAGGAGPGRAALGRRRLARDLLRDRHPGPGRRRAALSIPESPMYLNRSGNAEQARAVLERSPGSMAAA